jgi:hypothetical protein
VSARTGFTLALLPVFAVLCLGATLWIRRGFRAPSTLTTSEPTWPFKIRNLAIPASERYSKTTLDKKSGNPATHALAVCSPESQARQLFAKHPKWTSFHSLADAFDSALATALHAL